MMDTNTQRPKSRPWKRVLILVALPILIVAILVTLALPSLPSGGWSKDVKLSNGRMKMLVQFKTNPESPTAGTVTLMARIKEEGGFTSRVNELAFNYRAAGQQFAQSREGVPIGKFGTQGEGFYIADAELPFPGDWQVEIDVNHGGSRFNAAFPVVVKAQN